MPSLGERYKSKGYAPHMPLLVVPGLCSSILKVEDSTVEPSWKDMRIWLNLSAIGMGKVWDFNVTLFGDSRRKAATSTTGGKKKKADDDEELIEVSANIDESLKRRWIKHIVLQEDGVTDPPGIKVRALEGLKGCAYLETSNRATKALSYVMGPLFEMLQDIGYTDANLKAAPYDWRVPPSVLQARDGYFSKVKVMVEEMKISTGRRVVILGHSLGTRCVHYFLRWAEREYGRAWINDNIDTFVAVGPIFLGAPKTLRAMVTGERMGLEAFLFPEEGRALNRLLGSIPWMFPTRLQDRLIPTNLVSQEVGAVAPTAGAPVTGTKSRSATVVGAKKPKGPSGYRDVSDEELIANIYPPMGEIYRRHYLGDPLLGTPQQMVEPPPVDKLFAIYGINLETEAFIFLKPGANGLYELDPDGKFPNYKCRGGIASETKETPQWSTRRNRQCSGDGTVPYASMSYCLNWSGKNGLQVRVEELEDCDHRDILKDKRFLRSIMHYVCRNPPPPQLPESFPNLKYNVTTVFGGRKYDCTLKIQRKEVKLVVKGMVGLNTKVRYQAIIDVEINDRKPDEFRIEALGAPRLKHLRSKYRREIVEEVASRCRYVDRLIAEFDDEGEEEIEQEKAMRDERDVRGQTSLHRAASHNDTAEIAARLEQGADVNALDKSGWTPLHCAARAGAFSSILALLDSDAINVNMVNKEGLTALHYLVSIGATTSVNDIHEMALYYECLQRMGKKGVNVNLPGTDGEMPLHSVAVRGNEDALRWLIEHHARVNGVSGNGETALHAAVRGKHHRCVWLLMRAGADRHIVNKENLSPLAIAFQTTPDLFALLCGVPPTDAMADFPNTAPDALLNACLEKRIDRAFRLVHAGARKEQFHFQTDKGYTPLHVAAEAGNTDLLQILFSSPLADPCACTHEGNNALHLLVQHGYEDDEDDAVELLERLWERMVAFGAKVSSTNQQGETPLHLAVGAHRQRAAQWLLSNGANIESCTAVGETALHYAVRAKDRDMVQFLVERGANLNAVNSSQKDGTPQQLAMRLDPTLLEAFSSSPKRSTGSPIRDGTDADDDDEEQQPKRKSPPSTSPSSLSPASAGRRAKGRTAVFSRQSMILAPSIAEEATATAPASSSSSTGGSPSGAAVAAARRLHPSPLAAGIAGRKRNALSPTDTGNARTGAAVGSQQQAMQAMNEIRRVNEELSSKEFVGRSSSGKARVWVSGVGSMTKIETDPGATENDRLAATNAAFALQRKASGEIYQNSLAPILSAEVMDILTVYNMSLSM